MFVKDGIAYAGEPIPEMRIESARVTGELTMLVTFATGETRVFDASYLLAQPVFKALGDQEVFSKFIIDHGVITWADGEIDLAPESMYEHSYAYEAVA